MASSTNTAATWIPATKKVPAGRYIAYFKPAKGQEHRYGIITWPGVWMNKRHWSKGCLVTHLMRLPRAPK